MTALVAGEDIVYGDALFEVEGVESRATGEAVLFTATRVVHAVFTSAPADDEPPRRSSTADCRTWSRRLLQSVSTGGLDGQDNEDYRWHHDWGHALPTGTRLALRYADPGVSLRLPLDPTERRAEKLSALLPQLLGDLSGE